MVATYTIFGRQVGSHVLAMATLGSAGAIGYLSMGGKKSAKTDTPPINASSADEEKFIQEFLKAAEEEKKQKH